MGEIGMLEATMVGRALTYGIAIHRSQIRYQSPFPVGYLIYNYFPQIQLCFASIILDKLILFSSTGSVGNVVLGE